MKMTIVIYALFALFLLGCGLIGRRHEVQSFMPGMYTRFSVHEFGKEYDTLVISLQNPSANQYRIVRRWKYERVVDGKAMEPEYKIKASAAIFDTRHNLLQEITTGRIYTVDVSSKYIFSGTVKYKKL